MHAMRTRISSILVLLLLLPVAGCQQQAAEPRAHEHPLDVEYPSEGVLDLPFSDAVRVGNMLYLSGAIGTAPGTMELVEGGIAAETRQTMENIKATLEKYGSSMDEIVKCTVMIDDITEWGAVNEIYVTYFPNHKPARSAFGADGLALNASLEIECFATVQ